MKKFITYLTAGLLLVIYGVSATMYAMEGRSSAATTPTPFTIEIVGDSITVGSVPGGYREPLADLIQAASGTRPIIHFYAVGGWSTTDAAPGFPASLAAWNPDLVLYALGTNDSWDPNGGQQRTVKILSAVTNMTSAHFAVSFIEYSDPVRSGQPNLATGEAAVNDAWYRAYNSMGLLTTPFPPRMAGIADLQAMGQNCLDSAGVHPNAAGYQLEAALWFNALATHYGWARVALPTGCSTDGHRP